MKKPLPIFALTIQLIVNAQVPSMLKDLSVGSASSGIVQLYTLPNNDVLFYASTSSTITSGVYVSDGSTGGTNILKTFNNGKNLSGSSFLPYNGKVYMNGGYTYTAVPLWRTDGTTAGTDSIPITGIFGSGSNGISSMSVALNLIFITSGNKLWRSDGTTAGSYSIAAGITSVTFYETINNLLIFSATNTVTGIEMWRTDGTAAGTYMLKDIWPGPTSSFGNNPICGKYNNLLFFTADNQINGAELWRTDGTVNGTIMLKDIYPGAISSAINFQDAWSANNGLYFLAKDTPTNTEVWYSDGTSANTYSLINAIGGTSFPRNPVFVGNDAYFLSTSNNAIYKTNGTVAGTSSLSAIGSIANPTLSSENIMNRSLTLYNNELYYLTIRNNSGQDSICFRKVDLNLSTKSMVLKLSRPNTTIYNTWISIYDINALVANNHFLYFLGSSASGNGIPEMLVFNPVANQSRRFSITANNKVYFKTSDYIVNNKLYLPFQSSFYGPGYLDLTTDSLVPLVNPTSGIIFSCSNAPFNGFSDWNPCLYKLNNKYNFICHDPNYGVEFYETDFTKANTHLVKDVYPGVNPYFPPNSLCSFPNIWATPNNIYFLGNDGVNGFELWVFNNSPNNTVGIKESNQSKQEIILYPNPTNDVLHFKSNHPIHTIKIYNTIGDLLQSQFLDGSQPSTEIEINQLAKGIYLVEVETQTGKETRKFVKE